MNIKKIEKDGYIFNEYAFTVPIHRFDICAIAIGHGMHAISPWQEDRLPENLKVANPNFVAIAEHSFGIREFCLKEDSDIEPYWLPDYINEEDEDPWWGWYIICPKTEEEIRQIEYIKIGSATSETVTCIEQCETGDMWCITIHTPVYDGEEYRGEYYSNFVKAHNTLSDI